MRQIILDTETTGLSPQQGHRIIEIGCVEMVNRRYTGNRFHHYFNPEREVEKGALDVHGITNEFLADKPLFQERAQELKDFIAGAELIIHNAPFDISFLDHELKLAGLKLKSVTDFCAVIDTLPMARQKHPGQPNNLDALCRRYQVDNKHRDYHGALLDAKLLAEVYLAMTGGQSTLFGEDLGAKIMLQQNVVATVLKRELSLRVIRAEAVEQEAHLARLDGINKKSGGKTIWQFK